MSRWWRSHSVRVRLTLWYVAAMVVVLAIYATVVYVFVSRNASETLDRRLRGDFQWAAATVDVGPGGRVTAAVTQGRPDQEPDVIHVHEPLVPLVGWNATLGARDPVVGTFHTYSTSGTVNRVAANVIGARLSTGRKRGAFTSGAIRLPSSVKNRFGLAPAGAVSSN